MIGEARGSGTPVEVTIDPQPIRTAQGGGGTREWYALKNERSKYSPSSRADCQLLLCGAEDEVCLSRPLVAVHLRLQGEEERLPVAKELDVVSLPQFTSDYGPKHLVGGREGRGGREGKGGRGGEGGRGLEWWACQGIRWASEGGGTHCAFYCSDQQHNWLHVFTLAVECAQAGDGRGEEGGGEGGGRRRGRGGEKEGGGGEGGGREGGEGEGGEGEGGGRE